VPDGQKAYSTTKPIHFEHLQGCMARRHRVEAQGLALPLRTVAGLDQVEEPGGARGEAGSRGGVGPMTLRKVEAFEPVTLGHIRGHGCRDLPSTASRADQRGLAVRRDAGAVTVPADGLHQVRDDRRRLAPRLGAARQHAACLAEALLLRASASALFVRQRSCIVPNRQSDRDQSKRNRRRSSNFQQRPHEGISSSGQFIAASWLAASPY
jgi:hypothetical protein